LYGNTGSFHCINSHVQMNKKILMEMSSLKGIDEVPLGSNIPIPKFYLVIPILVTSTNISETQHVTIFLQKGADQDGLIRTC